MSNEKNYDEIVKEIKRSFDACFEIVKQVQQIEFHNWKEFVGPSLEEMLRSPKVAATYLRHRIPKFRKVALEVLAYHWGKEKEFARVIEAIAFDDKDLKVKITATCLLGSCYGKTYVQKIGHRLAKLILDESQPVELRSVAYFSLLSIHGHVDEHAQAVFRSTGILRFFQDVDRGFIESFCQ